MEDIERLRDELSNYNIPENLVYSLVAWVENEMSDGVNPYYEIREIDDQIEISIWDYTEEEGRISHWPFEMASYRFYEK